MSDGLLNIVFIAAIAAFLILRLRSVLGRRDGHEGRSDFDPFQRRESATAQGNDAQGNDKVIHLPDSRPNEAEPLSEEALDEEFAGSPAAEGLKDIKRADPTFDAAGFAEGAKGAFEMIITAFAKGDRESLRPLLSSDVFEEFAGSIKAREDANETLETTLIGIREAEIVEAELQGRTAFVTVQFVSEQVNVTRDSEHRIVDGDPNEVAVITDIWTFARNTRSRDPNWALVATRSPS